MQDKTVSDNFVQTFEVSLSVARQAGVVSRNCGARFMHFMHQIMHYIYLMKSNHHHPRSSAGIHHTAYSDEHRASDMLGFVYIQGHSELENLMHAACPKMAGSQSHQPCL